MEEEKEASADSRVVASTARGTRDDGTDQKHHGWVPIPSKGQHREAGPVAMPAAAVRKAGYSNRNRTTAVSPTQQQSLSSFAGTSRSPVRSLMPHLGPPSGKESRVHQRQGMVSSPSGSSLSSGSLSQLSPSSGLSTVRVFGDPAASRLKRPARSEDSPGVSAAQSLLKSFGGVSPVFSKKPVMSPKVSPTLWRPPLSTPSPRSVVPKFVRGPSSARRNGMVAAFVVIATLLLLAAVITTLVVTLRNYVPPTRGSKLCDTMHCRLHASLLTTRLNTSIDPCEDFSAYVCSAWTPSGDLREHAKTPVDGVALSRLEGMGTMLVQGTLKLPAGVKALVMHESCLSADDHDGLQQFRALMLEMGLSWPEPPQESKDALNVLLALWYKWQVPMWLEVHVLRGKWRLAFRPASVLPVILDHYESVRDIYASYWTGFYEGLGLNTTELINASMLEASVKEIHDMEGVILTNLSRFIFAKVKAPAVFPLGSIGDRSYPITSTSWMDALKENIALSPRLSTNDDVILSDENLLATIGSFFLNYTDQQILSHYAWLFVQMYAPLADSRMLWRLFGDMHKVNAYRTIFCGAQVESVYKVLILSLNVASRITKHDVVSIGAGFEQLVSAAVEKVNKSKWLDSHSKRVAYDKLMSVKMRVWPDQQLMKNEELEKIYKAYPSTGHCFAEIWMEARRSIRHSNEKTRHMDSYYEALGLPPNIAPSYPAYDYVSGNLSVPIYLLDQPLYYSRGTDAMFYGGLGYLLAVNLVKAIDTVGIRWLTNGTQVDSIFSEEATRAFLERDSCLKADGIQSAFPELSGFEIAYSALEAADKSGAVNRPLEKNLSPAKVFFMTVCYMACTISGYKNPFTADCNNMARNSAAFANTFKCSRGAKMNPEKKCRVFD